MERIEMLLAFIGASEQPVDPIRVMKGLFLFAQESKAAGVPKYEFVPYSYGPCSFEIYKDLDRLFDGRLIEKRQGDATWAEYCVTVEGQHMVSSFAKHEPAVVGELGVFREFVSSRDFRTLLTDVYAKYPAFAVKSVFQK